MANKIVSGELGERAAQLTGASSYHSYLEQMQRGLESAISQADGKTKPLFNTKAEKVWDTYLAHISPELRQENQCHCCRHFFERFGGLVTVDPATGTTSSFWTTENLPDDLRPAILAVKAYVEGCPVESVFFSDTANLGARFNGGFPHYALVLPKGAVFKSVVKSSSQLEAESIQEYQTLRRALSEFSEFHLSEAVRILGADALARSEKFLAQAEWLLDLKKRKPSKRAHGADTVVWAAVAEAPAGWCSPRSSMIGTLLEDLAAGLDTSSVQAKWAAKMHPLQYQRPQAAPSSGTVKQAEELFGKLGLAPSLLRRFARLDDVKETLWSPPAARDAAPSKPTSLFGDIATKDGSRGKAQESPRVLPAQTMTWAKFVRTVLPGASGIEARVPRGPADFAALVTASNPSAPPLLQWDREDSRNPVSQYRYNGGSPASRWGLECGALVKVNAIVREPKDWGAPGAELGKRILLLLDGA